MEKQKESGTFSCYVVGEMHHWFADERIKWHMLDLLADIQKKQGWIIYAFCLMDDDAYFVIEAEDAAEAEHGVQQAAEQTMERLCGSICFRGSEGSSLLRISSEKLNSLDEIIDRCRQIHRLPLVRGYVSRLSDYWWSSYNTYIRAHDWQMVDSQILLLQFSADPEDAVRKLRRFHRKQADLDLS